MKAWAFYRRSTDKQELSIEDQRRECRAFAAARGWQLVREFEPSKGFATGLTIDRDTTFLEMVRLAEIGGHGVHHLVVYDVSRFGRLHQDDKIYWERRFKKQGGIEIVYVKDDFRNDGSLGDGLTRYVKHAEAHEYSRKLSELTFRGSKSRAALGHSTGGPAPYGYERMVIEATGSPGRILKPGEHAAEGQHVIWTPSGVEAAIVRQIFDQYGHGWGLLRIAEDLNARGIPPPSSNRSHRRAQFWCKSTVHAILRNRVYIGTRVYNRNNCKPWRRGEGGPFRKPASEWVVKENAHEPIITREVFDQTQATFRRYNFGSGRSYSRPYLLTGIGRCGHCGYSLTGSIKDKHRRYSCSGYARIGPRVCQNYSIPAEEIEKLALDTIRRQMHEPRWKDRVKQRLMDFTRTDMGIVAPEQTAGCRQQLQEIERQIGNVTHALQEIGYSEALGSSLRALEAKRDALRSMLKELDCRAKAALEAVSGPEERLLTLAEDFDSRWARTGTDERKEMLKAFLYGVQVHPLVDCPI